MRIFYCTHCGTRLQVDEHLAGQMVCCANCSSATLAPDDALPIAEAVDDTIEAAEIAPVPVLPLDYRSAYVAPRRRRSGEPIEVLAERLNRVETPETGEGGLTDCPYCGSSIASFVGRCPFCRHTLRGS